jgi:hypothetical protein
VNTQAQMGVKMDRKGIHSVPRSWLRRFVVRLSRLVGFVVDGSDTGTRCYLITSVSACAYRFTNTAHAFTCHRPHTMVASDSVVKSNTQKSKKCLRDVNVCTGLILHTTQWLALGKTVLQFWCATCRVGS